MRSIERLPEASRSSMRSGVVICDLTRIIEELIFNSLDAGATKVSVEVGVGSSYIKVVDNGSGITRDGLVLLGERYATSKVDQLARMDTASENFNFHGEALCSISDVSLLEVITKARGKPSGYRKIMKNTKCLFLGINDDRQDAGTAVIVRDIFYNQPVRRKQMESSPKKVLDSIKMSVLRIALVHLNVSFKVVDVESADELLRTGPSSSPLPLLSSSFGIEISATFHKLNLSAGEFQLSGYISDPHEIFSLKAVQYVYINSRFICKGPIHKLVNELAARFDLSSPLQPATSFLSEKHNKHDMSPTFILNLHCPRSYYDIITSERSRASVEFKDWGPVLTFIENSIMVLWMENISNDMLDSFRSGKKRFRKQNHQTPLYSSAKPKKLHKNYDNIPPLEEHVSSFVKPSRNFSEVKMCPTEAGLLSETDYLSQSCDASLNASPCSIFPPDQVAYAFSEKPDNISTPALGNIFPMFGDKIGDASTPIRVSANCLQFSDDIHVYKDSSRSFLRTCSFERSLLHERKSSARDERLEFGIDDITTRQKRIDYDNSMGDEIDLAICGRGLQCDGAPQFCSPITRSDIHEMLESPVRDLVESSLVFRDITPITSKQVGTCSSSWKYFISDWSPLAADKTTGIKLLEDDNGAICKSLVEGCSEFGVDPIHGYSAMREDEDLKGSNLNTKDDWQQPNCSFMNIHPDCKREVGDFELGDFGNMFSPKPFKRFNETNWSSLPSYGEVIPKNISVPSLHYAPHVEHECYRNQEAIYNQKKCLNRSYSAPPFHKLKKRYLDLAYSSSILSATRNFQDVYASLSSTETSDFTRGQFPAVTRNLKCSEKPYGQCSPSPMKRPVLHCSSVERPGLEMEPTVIAVQSTGQQTSEQFINMELVEGPNLKEIQDSLESGGKWRNSCLQTSVKGESISDDVKNQDTILDIFHFAGDFVVPKSIDRTSLEDAKVLNQVDKKFIAVVARKTLAIIDQHAADERIRLEELRHKVLSGEMRTIKHLDAERDLVLPEIGYQLLQNYVEQVQTWGWICNIHSQDTSSFTKHLDFLHREPTVVKLLAVPCILGVTLSDLDLLEFLQQLSDTDGSAAIPPAVHSVLNNKACRGAIMFGDTLLPSECSLIVEELKQTSLCFQCAHGRPTTVPLVNLDLLHNKIAKIGSHKSWHSLRRHRISLQRSADRLSSSLC